MVSENLKLSATSDEDLRVISAHLQDSITQIANIVHLKKNKIFLIQFNRFMWENIEKGVLNLLNKITYWKEAPVWTPKSIKKATKIWFKLLKKK